MRLLSTFVTYLNIERCRQDVGCYGNPVIGGASTTRLDGDCTTMTRRTQSHVWHVFLKSRFCQDLNYKFFTQTRKAKNVKHSPDKICLHWLSTRTCTVEHAPKSKPAFTVRGITQVNCADFSVLATISIAGTKAISFIRIRGAHTHTHLMSTCMDKGRMEIQCVNWILHKCWWGINKCYQRHWWCHNGLSQSLRSVIVAGLAA